MRINKPVTTLLAGLTLAGGLLGYHRRPHPLPALSAGELIEKHATALGGRDVLQRIGGWRMLWRMGGDTPGQIETWVRANDRVRVASLIGHSRRVLLFDGRNGWTQGAAGTSSMGPKSLRSLRARAFLDYLLACQAPDCQIAPADPVTVDSRPCYGLEVRWREGLRAVVALDATSYFVTRVSTVLDMSAREAASVDSDYSDYRAVDRVPVPHSIRVSGKYGVFVMQLARFELNPPLDETTFNP